MGKERADLGFGNELDSFNPDDWKPRKKTSVPEASQTTRQAAEKAGFKSREAPPAVPVPIGSQRRRRTGRNAQFNIKAKPETIAAFCAVADAQGWGLGETLEHAVKLLERDFGSDTVKA